MKTLLPRFRILSVLLCIGIGVLVILSLDFGAYKQHHFQSTPRVTGEQNFLSDVSIKKGPISESWMIELIDAAKSNVSIAVYSFTLPSLREALLRAKNRGVMVEIILEKSPFGATTINRDTIQFFKTHGLSYHLSTADQFAFMHAKYSIIDNQWIIETANWTRASFGSNREFFIIGHDVGILQNLTKIFQEDFSGKRGYSQDNRILAGPTNARERLLQFLSTSKKSIDIYAPDFSDGAMIESLNSLCNTGVSVKILLAKYEDALGSKIDYGPCISIRIMKKPLHAKVLIRDRESAFIGSFNYTANSLENNRELGLFVNEVPVQSVYQTFVSDWNQSEVALH